jgi:hypothetical protein
VPVCVFAKPPLPGAVKTRLARGVGARRAAQLALAFFHDTWATVGALPWARPILASTTPDLSAFALGGDVEVWLQGTGDLGARMERVLERGIAEAGRALVIGTDIPGLPAGHLEEAQAALARHEAVIGPAEDGGFYLLGLSRITPGLLADLPWSAPDTRARTEERLTRAGLSPARIPAWFDVDEPEDLARLQRLLVAHPGAAPRTRRALATAAPVAE